MALAVGEYNAQISNLSAQYERQIVLNTECIQKKKALNALLREINSAKKKSESARGRYSRFKVAESWRGRCYEEFDQARRDAILRATESYDSRIGDIQSRISQDIASLSARQETIAKQMKCLTQSLEEAEANRARLLNS